MFERKQRCESLASIQLICNNEHKQFNDIVEMSLFFFRIFGIGYFETAFSSYFQRKKREKMRKLTWI